MARYTLAPITVRGKAHVVQVNDYGEFFATYNQATFTAPTLDGLKQKLGDAMRTDTKKVRVPFVKAGYDRDAKPVLRKGVGTGIHAGHGGVLIRWDDGEHENWSSYSPNNQVLQPLSPEEEAELIALATARDEAVRRYDDYVGERTFNVHKAVKAAMGRPDES